MNISPNDSDIIEATPSNVSLNDSEIIYATPVKVSKKPRKAKSKKSEANCFTTQKHECWNFVNQKIHETAFGSVHYNKPFVYYEISEIIRLFNQNRFLKHNNVHLLGFYRYDPEIGHILSDNKIAFGSFVKLDLKVINDSPVENNLLSAYGSIEVIFNGCKKHLIFALKFFRTENDGYYNQYKEKLKLVRNFVPSCYFEQIVLENS